MAKSGFGCKFHDLKDVDIEFFYIPWIHYEIENTIINICRKKLLVE